MRAHESLTLSNISASAFFPNANLTGQGYLEGGRYMLLVSATWGGGSAQLQMIGPDGTTLINVSPVFTINGSSVIDLPPGPVKLAVTTATALYAMIVRVPIE